MSVTIQFQDVLKKYGETTVIPGLSLEVKEGEFFTLLGPSGCGKTTLLRMVAGFNSIEGGDIRFNGKRINDLPPGKRNIGMVFQNYAIFPHMNVQHNIAFGLTNRHIPKEEIEKKVEKILSTVQIQEYKNRMPEHLSGGQQQRVALARAIVIEPDVLLMDEPLSNLDAKLRIDMRNAIKEIQNNIHITTIYVTHDQEEAMAVSDRIAIMDKGIIQHIGNPREIYRRPANLFVATFIGHTNILDGTLSQGKLSIGSYTEKTEIEINKGEIPVKVSIRPEEFYISDDKQGLAGTIINSVFLGLNTHYFISLEQGTRIEFVDQSGSDNIYKSGEKVLLKIHTKRINIFDKNGEHNLSTKTGGMI
ncbi:Fe(3+) ions import ATP-binding protein FbpC [Spirochaetia bacterium]|nr:Fe(3+) ions import ATP-binding protein FbpC [Spirochaetia bacterium]GHU31302.1 Fe(3+) ions import ATP-binding protein FbpC [Spirochaetia bacterium]